MGKYQNNLIVIGAGSAGLIAALVGSTLRAKVVLVESDRMGGDCLNTGCVPSKTLIASAKVAQTLRQSERYGIGCSDIEVNFPSVMHRVRQAVATIEPNDSIERYSSLGVQCLQGRAELTSPHEVRISGETHSARSIVLAMGAGPSLPPVPGLEKANPLTSENLWDIDELPAKLVVLGGGPIGCELAQAFARLGSQVSIVEMLDRLLPLEDPDASELIAQTLSNEGIRIHTGFEAKSCTKDSLVMANDDEKRTLDFDRLLVATGRTPRSVEMGLEEVGVQLNADGTVAVNDNLRTSIRSIYACGDVVGPYQFTHMASQQAWHASVNALIRPYWQLKLDTRIIPWAIFTDPEVARVGLSEKEAEERNIPVDVTKWAFTDSDRAIAEGRTEGFVKLITARKKDTLLGACIVGSHAGELISLCINAMSHGYGLDKVLSTLFVYPTRMEAIRMAAGARRKARAPEGLLSLSQKLNEFLR